MNWPAHRDVSTRLPRFYVLLLLLGLGGYFWFVPTLTSAGFPSPGPRSLWLAVLALAGTQLLLRAALTQAHATPEASILTLVPLISLIASFIKSDYAGVLAHLISIFVLMSLAYSDARAVAQAFRLFLPCVVLLSVIASTLFAGLTILGRDFLPFVIAGRAVGVVGHPNTLGILAALLVATGILGNDRNAKIRLGIGVLGLLAAASQTAILATLVGCLVLLTMRTFRCAGAAGATILASFGAALLYFANSYVASGAQPVGLDLTLTGRTEIWQVLLAQDVGWFGLSDSKFTELTFDARGVRSAHNLWLEVWSRTGPIGLTAAIVTYIFLLRKAVRWKNEALIFFVAFFGVLSITEGVLLTLPLSALFAGFVVWCYPAQDRDANDPAQSAMPQKVPLAVIEPQ